MSQITKETIIRLLKLEMLATAGPWIGKRWNDDGLIVEVNDSTGWKEDYPHAYIAKLGGWGYAGKNGELIAESRNHIKELCEDWLKLTELLEHEKVMKRELDHYKKFYEFATEKNPNDLSHLARKPLPEKKIEITRTQLDQAFKSSLDQNPLVRDIHFRNLCKELGFDE